MPTLLISRGTGKRYKFFVEQTEYHISETLYPRAIWIILGGNVSLFYVYAQLIVIASKKFPYYINHSKVVQFCLLYLFITPLFII